LKEKKNMKQKLPAEAAQTAEPGADSAELINTPETLGVTPRYVLQANAISRSAHNLSAPAKKLTAMAMALLPADLSSLTASFTFTQFCKALGEEKGGKQYEIFKAAVDECMKCIIYVETAPDKKGKKTWKKFTWFTFAEFSEATGQATMKFSSELAGFLTAMKRVYSRIGLRDIGSLQSRYGIRIFELVMSYAFLNGKQGCQPGEWYVQESIDEFRHLLSVPEGAYKETHLFKQKVIEGPVKEINEADIGVTITPENVKEGRKLAAVRLNCRKASRTATRQRKGKKGKKAAPAAALPLPDTGAGRDREAKENEHLRELHPDEFAAFYAEELAKMPPVMQGHAFAQEAAAGGAFIRLREKYGILK
jgi:plasmid replication initiation protein